MIRKSLVSAIALALCSPALISAQNTSAPVANYPQVKKVMCDHSSGTAFRVEGNLWVSAAHVTDDSGCRIDGLLINATAEPELDLSTAPAPPSDVRGFKVNCNGFKPGRWVFAIGHARGWSWQTMIMSLATFQKDLAGKRAIFGLPAYIPGMSGGPVLNEDGTVAGVVNAYVPGTPWSLSRELKDSSICKNSASAPQ